MARSVCSLSRISPLSRSGTNTPGPSPLFPSLLPGPLSPVFVSYSLLFVPLGQINLLCVENLVLVCPEPILIPSGSRHGVGDIVGCWEVLEKAGDPEEGFLKGCKGEWHSGREGSHNQSAQQPVHCVGNQWLQRSLGLTPPCSPSGIL